LIIFPGGSHKKRNPRPPHRGEGYLHGTTLIGGQAAISVTQYRGWDGLLFAVGSEMAA